MADVEARLSRICKLFAQAIKELRVDIEKGEASIRDLKDRLAALTAKPAPDPDAIALVKQMLSEAEFKLESDRAQLNAFEEEFSASCS